MELKFPEGKDEVLILGPGDSVHLPAGTIHRFTGILDSEIFEFSTHHSDDDVVRIEKGDTLEDTSIASR